MCTQRPSGALPAPSAPNHDTPFNCMILLAMRSLPCAAENCGNASHMFLSAVARRVRRAVLELSFDVMSVRMISSQEISAGTIHRKLGQASRPEACGASSVCASRATRAYSVQPLAVGLILLGRNSYSTSYCTDAQDSTRGRECCAARPACTARRYSRCASVQST